MGSHATRALLVGRAGLTAEFGRAAGGLRAAPPARLGRLWCRRERGKLGQPRAHREAQRALIAELTLRCLTRRAQLDTFAAASAWRLRAQLAACLRGAELL